MADSMLYFLVQWEDRFLGVIQPRSVVFPKKAMSSYVEGEIIKAVYRNKEYEAVICEIHPNRKHLLQRAKQTPKYFYSVESKKASCLLRTSQASETSKTAEKIHQASKTSKTADKVPKAFETSKTADKTDKVPKVVEKSASRKHLLQRAKRTPMYYYSVESKKASCLLRTSQASETSKTAEKIHQVSKTSKTADQLPKAFETSKTADKTDKVPKVVEKSAVMLSTPQRSVVTMTQWMDTLSDTRKISDTAAKYMEKQGVRESPSVGTKRRWITTDDCINELIKDRKSLRRKIKRLEERVADLEKKINPEKPDDGDDLLKLVEHLDDTDVQKVLVLLACSIFSEDELIMSSRTGKRTNKCSGNPRPPLDQDKLNKLETLILKKTKISRNLFQKKLENLQKTLRHKRKIVKTEPLDTFMFKS